ncbi:uncharacterized protein G2W53_041000 [Senna tora]|uniref:Uncharacterized protein n=1 Tax=Senna tora TaxID=362788 RepID=A0A834W2H9_9FABA|nr:uncharacterized protein G2W53_041000 [Senna tora]
MGISFERPLLIPKLGTGSIRWSTVGSGRNLVDSFVEVKVVGSVRKRAYSGGLANYRPW